MTIGRRLQVTTGVFILFALGTASILFWSSLQVGRGIEQTETTARLVRSTFMLNILMDEYLDHGKEQLLEEWELYFLSIGKELDNKMNSGSVHPGLLEDLRRSYQSVKTILPRVIEMKTSTASDDPGQELKEKEMLTGLMSVQLEQLANAAIDLSVATHSLTLKRRYYVQGLIVALAVSAVAILLINIHLIRKSVVEPLSRLATGAERIGEGDFEYIAETKGDDEVGKLTSAFKTMIDGLRKRTVALNTAQNELKLTIEERTAALQVARTQNEMLQAVHGTQAQFISGRNPGELFEDLLRHLLALTRSEFGFIGEILYTEDGRMFLRDRAITDISWDEESRTIYKKFSEDKELDLYDLRGLWGTVILTGEPVISNDPANDPRRGGLPQGHPPLHSFLGIPFHSDGQVIGMAAMANRPDGYEEELVQFLQPYVTTCANIIEAYRNENRRLEAERKLSEAHANLERQIQDRTAELQSANEQLVLEAEQRKQVQERLVRSNQDLDHFAYAASHDLQEPLRNVTTCLQLLERGHKEKLEPDADKLMQYAVDSAARMRNLITDLLRYSRVTTKEETPRRIDTQEILMESPLNLDSVMKISGAVVTHDGLPTIEADPIQLSQVFQNLIGNAIKFRREEQPRIHISAKKNDGEWVFSVRDNGIGIDPKYFDKIFVVFQQLDKKRKDGGTGIGLAIVHKIVERHGGRVWVESEVGVGSTFHFTIPGREVTKQ